MTEPLPEIMDAPMIRRELGVNETEAAKIVRWCAQVKGRVIKKEPPEGRKTWVYREDVRAWLTEHERSAA